ncbi:hypothetical protein FRC19_003705 [Serendipita sp. 401]|nr:hypothetical protein FRC19_003705 [Serendipita sp. 401]
MQPRSTESALVQEAHLVYVFPRRPVQQMGVNTSATLALVQQIILSAALKRRAVLRETAVGPTNVAVGLIPSVAFALAQVDSSAASRMRSFATETPKGTKRGAIQHKIQV